jgi:hypothetical protein
MRIAELRLRTIPMERELCANPLRGTQLSFSRILRETPR